jgi:ABC-2 type transport system ATP-binding protein
LKPVIEISGVSKRYVKLADNAMLLRSIVPWTRPARTEHWALKALDFTVEPGELVGVIGHNGAGKTTLLRLLAGVTSPTRGRVLVRGRIAPLISVGVGFHEEMTGRENVLINGMLLGLSARQVHERFDSIVDFAELWKFIDTPVKFYSSGMSLRLGFAVVTHIDPSILLVDEILAVGDASFQLKCFDRLRQFQDDGAAILVVSHALHQIRTLCDRAILLRHGALEWDGDVEGAINKHEALGDSAAGTSEHEFGAVEFVEVRYPNDVGSVREYLYDETAEIALRLRFTRAVSDPQLIVGLLTDTGSFGGFNATPAGDRWRTFAEGEECEARVAFPVRLGGGRYRLVFEVREADGGRILGRHQGPALQVSARPGISGLVGLETAVSVARD